MQLAQQWDAEEERLLNIIVGAGFAAILFFLVCTCVCTFYYCQSRNLTKKKYKLDMLQKDYDALHQRFEDIQKRRQEQDQLEQIRMIDQNEKKDQIL